MRLNIFIKTLSLIIIFSICFPNSAHAESTLSTIKDIIKEEINRGKTQIKEELQRALDQTNKNVNNDEYKSVVPNLFGKTPQEAEYLLPQYHLVLGKVIDKESSQPAGTIISQNYAPDIEVKQQTTISVEVAVPPREHSTATNTTIVAPNVQGIHVNKAKTTLKKLGLTVGNIETHESNSSDGIVIHQQPKAGTKLHSRGKLDLIVAKQRSTQGKEKVELSLSKKQVNVAETIEMTAITPISSKTPLEYSFTINGKVYPSSSNRLSHRFSSAGKFIITANVRKKRGKWQHSKSQWLIVEAQPKQQTDSNKVVMPRVIGLSLDEAKTLLTDKKLIVSKVLQENTEGAIGIIKQSPTAGSLLMKGSNVILTQAVNYDIKSKLPANKEAWNEPRAIIEPSSLVVTKGDKATFISQSSHDKNTDLTLYWMDEKGGSGSKNTYSINTKDWDEGEYWISLRVKDQRGFEHTSKAELIISKPLSADENTPISTKVDSTNVTAKDIKLSLSASSYYVASGRPVQFTITQDPATQSTYQIIFGDGNTASSIKPWVEYSYSHIGRQVAYVEMSYQKKRIQSEKITLWVLPSWLLISAIASGLLFFFILLKKLLSKKKTPIQKENETVRYMPIIDEGEQIIETEPAPKLQNKNTHFSFEVEKDVGKQWIAYSEQTKD